jgi:hypothetical protein
VSAIGIRRSCSRDGGREGEKPGGGGSRIDVSGVVMIGSGVDVKIRSAFIFIGTCFVVILKYFAATRKIAFSFSFVFVFLVLLTSLALN